MKYFYDTEFIEDGRTIDLVSIGIVAEDGREFYAVSQEFDQRALVKNNWLVENVLPSLPYFRTAVLAEVLFLDIDHSEAKLVKPRHQIADEVYSFLAETDKDIELWAYYGAYDHVALMQLWGRMIDKPDGIPMWTRDIMQILGSDPIEALPQASGHHNALADARHVKAMYDALTGAGVRDER